jgi:hypothetical protein
MESLSKIFGVENVTGWYSKSKSASEQALQRLAGSPVLNFGMAECKELLTYLNFVYTRQSGTHQTWTNIYNGNTVTWKAVQAQNPSYTLYTGLKEKGYTRQQLQYYVDHRKELLAERRKFYQANPGKEYVPRLGPKAIQSPDAPAPREPKVTQYPEEFLRNAVGLVNELSGGDKDILDECIDLVATQYEMPPELLRARISA